MRDALEKVREGSNWMTSLDNCHSVKELGLAAASLFLVLACHSLGSKQIPHATVHIQVDMDGGVTVHTGAADIGQGSTTAVAQVVAEVLALPIEMIHVRSHESDTSPVDLGSYSSRVIS
ncbi:MAG: hypothetical protein CM15mP8_3820 [Methanobacteriota archaeon]|nr:MAG: hypothetical protein CM15mP8_3820 [Euryarchaeota archaeon]